MVKTAQGLVDYAVCQIGQAYWWGCFGQVATKELLEYKKKQYPSVYNSQLYNDVEAQFGKRVFDCVGLVKGYLWSDKYDSEPVYNSLQDVNVVGLYTCCNESGMLSSKPEIPGICLFTKSLDHVGVYIGNNKVVEARGHNYGVVTTIISDRFWYFWGKPKWIKYEKTEPYEEPYYNLSTTDKKFIDKLGQLELGMNGVNVKLLQILLRNACINTPIDGVFGENMRQNLIEYQTERKLEIDGICGKNTWTALIK